MKTIQKITPAATLSLMLLITPISSFSQSEIAEKVTLESLLAETLQASRETRAIFDKEQEQAQLNDTLAPNIAFAPSIDITYQQVSNNISHNIGSNVRWGGQVIDSVMTDPSTMRLTVIASQLSTEGRPSVIEQNLNSSHRFKVIT